MQTEFRPVTEQYLCNYCQKQWAIMRTDEQAFCGKCLDMLEKRASILRSKLAESAIDAAWELNGERK